MRSTSSFDQVGGVGFSTSRKWEGRGKRLFFLLSSLTAGAASGWTAYGGALIRYEFLGM